MGNISHATLVTSLWFARRRWHTSKNCLAYHDKIPPIRLWQCSTHLHQPLWCLKKPTVGNSEISAMRTPRRESTTWFVESTANKRPSLWSTVKAEIVPLTWIFNMTTKPSDRGCGWWTQLEMVLGVEHDKVEHDRSIVCFTLPNLGFSIFKDRFQWFFITSGSCRGYALWWCFFIFYYHFRIKICRSICPYTDWPCCFLNRHVIWYCDCCEEEPP